MISQRLIEKYSELEEKRYWIANTKFHDHKTFMAYHAARKQWNRVFKMYCNPDSKK